MSIPATRPRCGHASPTPLKKKAVERSTSSSQNHVEKDHSGALVEIHRKIRMLRVTARRSRRRDCAGTSRDRRGTFRHVKSGDTLELGKKTLAFVQAPFLPGLTRCSPSTRRRALFPNDAFGQHLCCTQRLDTGIPRDVLMDAAQKFYANRLFPLPPLFRRRLRN